MKRPPSLAAIRRALRPLGVVVTRVGGEFRVRETGAPAGVGYFTTDAQDAWDTGKAMVLHRERAAAAVVLASRLGRMRHE